jgi:UDP:flavonoid glycosyltransferase YjiC (YdhE family)
MRVLFSTHGSRGDLEPTIGLALKSQTRRAEVRV